MRTADVEIKVRFRLVDLVNSTFASFEPLSDASRREKRSSFFRALLTLSLATESNKIALFRAMPVFRARGPKALNHADQCPVSVESLLITFNYSPK